MTTLAGSTTSGHSDGTGTLASFNGPYAVTTDGANLYVADYLNNEIRKIVISTLAVTTIAGSYKSSGSSNGTGAAASFDGPDGITTDGTNLYVADFNNNEIRKIVISTGVVTTLVGTAAGLNGPGGITTDGTNLYVADYGNNEIRKI